MAFLAQTSNAMATQSVAPLAPLFQPDLALTKAEVGFFSSAAYAGAWAVLLVSGSLTDRFGVRVMVSTGLLAAGFTLASMSMVSLFPQAVAVMFVAGLGRGAVLPGGTKAVMDWFSARGRATAMGIKQAGVPMAGILAASTLPAIGLVAGWRAAIGLVGMMLVAGGLVTALVYRDPPRNPGAARGRGGMRAGLREVARNRALWNVSSIAVLFVTAQTCVITYLALYLTEVVLPLAIPDENSRIIAAGGYLALCQLGGVIGRVSWGMVSDRFLRGRRVVGLAFLGGAAAILLLFMATSSERTPVWLLAVTVFAIGTTCVGWNGLYHALLVDSIDQKHAATGVGLSMSFTQVGVVGGPPLFGLILDLTGSYAQGWTILASLFGLGAILALLHTGRESHVV